MVGLPETPDGAIAGDLGCWARPDRSRYSRIGFLARELLDEIPYTLATV